MPNQPPQINIKATDEELRGHYANAMQVAHTKEEVILDFLTIVPPHGQLVSRVITSPAHAKRIVTALSENIKTYEKNYGPLEPSQDRSHEIGFASNA
jgi:hypothetical protein